MKKMLGMSAVILLSATFTATAAEQKAPPPSGMPAGHGAMTGTATPSGEPISGKVLQTMNGGGYSYAYIQKKKGGVKVWVAVPETPIKVGKQMSFQPGMEMKNFESKTLKKTFASVIFSSGVVNAAAAPKKGASQSAPAAQVPPGSKAAVAPKDAKASVTKATGSDAVTIEEAFANSTKLDKKKVVVRGKVVKVSARIMGKNWIHIQDGTGSQAKGTYDLVCTSTETPNVNDVVTISGTLAKDKDFGGGYRYSVILENATVKK